MNNTVKYLPTLFVLITILVFNACGAPKLDKPLDNPESLIGRYSSIAAGDDFVDITLKIESTSSCIIRWTNWSRWDRYFMRIDKGNNAIYLSGVGVKGVKLVPRGDGFTLYDDGKFICSVSKY